MNDHESEAMWRLYAKTNEAIALQTTYGRLVDAFEDTILIGAVRYIDYDNEKAIFPMSSFRPFTSLRTAPTGISHSSKS